MHDATRRHATRHAAQRDTRRDATRLVATRHAASRDATQRATPHATHESGRATRNEAARHATHTRHATCSTRNCVWMRVRGSVRLAHLHKCLIPRSARQRVCAYARLHLRQRHGARRLARYGKARCDASELRLRARRGAVQRAPLRACFSPSACACSRVHVRAHKYPEHREKIIKTQNCAVIYGGVLLPRSGSA